MTDSDKLGLGLDDIIRNDRTTNRRGGRGGGGGGNRGFRARTGRGSANGFRTRGGGGIPRTTNPLAAGRWKHDLYENNTNQNREVQRTAGVNSTTKLLISNLDFGVTTNDIEELFEDVGAIRIARVHYDENGRPMDIRLVGGVDDRSKLQSNRFTSANGGNTRNQRFGGRMNNQPNGVRGNRGRGGRQQQNGSGGKKEDISAEDLDAELDAYRAETKQKK
ncbi:unnamed protein product [Rotaria socialis]|uniref:Chromatin target of PRMT1 protein C-terminal domain-containing protein n=1 Tax=Rotaria socialis TaxID=392032 RepID=A0A818R0N5_9BILA|nr:unnamed protein product [Rotaria socialis]CAF4465304.1 unnamed protein product [Rotaria socialis]